MNKDNIIIDYSSLEVSYFENGIKDTKPKKNITLDEFLEMVRNPTEKVRIILRELRMPNISKERKNEIKAKLPYTTISGTFKKRSDEGLIQHSGLIQIDFDALNEAKKEIRKTLEADEYILALFDSPSGTGLKGIAKISNMPTSHRDCFLAMEKYFLDKYDLKVDESCKDISRALFLSYDPDFYVNYESKPFEPLLRNEESQYPTEEQEYQLANIKISKTDAQFAVKENRFETPFELCEYFVRKNGFEFVDKGKHKFRLQLAILLRIYSVSFDETLRYIQQKYPSQTIDEDKKTTEWVFDKVQATKSFTPYSEFKNKKTYQNPKLPIVKSTSTKNLCGKDYDEIIELAYESEVGISKIIELLFVNKAIFNHTRKSWHLYTEGSWEIDLKKQFLRIAPEEVKKVLWQCILHLIDQQKHLSLVSENEERNVKRKKDDFSEKEADLKQIIDFLSKRRKIDDVIELAQRTKLLSYTQEDLDKHNGLLNLKNGTYNFDTLQLQEHNPDDLLTMKVNITFDEDAKCPKWIEFLEIIFLEDKELITYIQKVVGLCLTGYIGQQAFWFCYGNGANGKSTFFNVLKMLIEPYYHSANIEAFLSAEKVAYRNTDLDKANFYGKRVVVASEIDKDRKLNESAVKDLTGNDTIQAKFLYKNQFNFKPTFKLFMFGNHKPIISGNDYGIWRRVKLIPFSYKFPEHQQKDMEKDVLPAFRAELSGILNWAIEGYRLYRQEGMKEPKIVKIETNNYMDSQDTFKEFMTEYCNTDSKNVSCKSKDLFQSYKKWCSDNDEVSSINSSKEMNNYLRNKDFIVKEGAQNLTFCYGIEIKKDNLFT